MQHNIILITFRLESCDLSQYFSDWMYMVFPMIKLTRSYDTLIYYIVIFCCTLQYNTYLVLTNMYIVFRHTSYTVWLSKHTNSIFSASIMQLFKPSLRNSYIFFATIFLNSWDFGSTRRVSCEDTNFCCSNGTPPSSSLP